MSENANAPFPIYEVRVSEVAEAEIEDTIFYLTGLSPQNANRWHEGLLVALRSLEVMPTRCPLAPENDRFERDIRQLLYRTSRNVAYRILFTILGEAEDEPAFVRVLHVIHGARRYLGE